MALSTVTPLLPAPDRAPMICDAFREPITNPTVTDIDSAVRAFFQTAPDWLEKIMKARNAIVGRLGFDTGVGVRHELPDRFEPGHQAGVFGIIERSDDEIVMGGDDTHFSFRLSLWIPDGTHELQATTLGQHHTTLGRAYLTVVRPGHRLIAPMMVKRAARGAS